MAALKIVLEPDLDPVQTGIWCPRCNLPSGWRVPLIGISTSGIGHLCPITRCGDCDQPIPE